MVMAGAVVDRLRTFRSTTRQGSEELNAEEMDEQESHQLNDQARLAAAAWRAVPDGSEQTSSLARLLRQSRGGRNLLQIGQQADIDLAARYDALDIVPELDVSDGVIRVK